MAYSLDYYKRLLRNKQAEIASRKSKNNALKKDIERLESAYEKLKKIKKMLLPTLNMSKKKSKLINLLLMLHGEVNQRKILTIL